MKISLCTITFRHHLLSMEDIAHWATSNHFDGIELWGIHAINMSQHGCYDADWLAEFGLGVPMISDYLPTEGPSSAMRDRALLLCGLARHWRAPRLRTFAGGMSSAVASPDDWTRIANRLREACRIAADYGISLVVETHPNTLADRLSSTMRLIAEVDHPALTLNFDVLHVWEGGDDPVAARRALLPHIGYYHLKTIRSRGDLSVFEPGNVYAAAGRREGMMPLLEGAVDYDRFLPDLLGDPDAEASLEWFGPECFSVLRNDRLALGGLAGRSRTTLTETVFS
jgi:3-dehydroshikimate dehydratase